MNRTEIIELQRRVGTKPDGWWGPKSEAACRRHLRSLMPEVNPWPSPAESSMRRFYGAPGNSSFTPPGIISVDAPKWMRLYDSDTQLGKIRVHERCADSLLRALAVAYEFEPDAAKRFFGCYVGRPVRGGTTPSKHAYGAAIDLSATGNGLRTHWPTKARMPLGVMEAFAREGWTAAGAFWSRDAMHFQATRP